MKVKVCQLVGSSEPLGRLMSQPMGSVEAFRCAKLVKAVQSELESYEEARKNLIEQHGKNGEIKQTSKNFKVFVNELEKLMEEEITLDAEKLDSSKLDSIEISPIDILALEWLIKESK